MGRMCNGIRAFAIMALAAALLSCGSGAAPAPQGSPVTDPPASATPSPATAPTVRTPAGPTPSIAEARELWRSGAWEASADAYRSIATAARDDPALRAEALLGAAVADWTAGRRDIAVDTATAAVQAAPAGSDVSGVANFALGRWLNELGRGGESIQRLRGADSSFQGTPALERLLRLELARALQGSGEHGEARVLADSLLVDPLATADERRAAAAIVAETAGQMKDLAAVVVARARLAELSQGARTLEDLARAQDAAGRPAEAAATRLKLVTMYPDTGRAQTALIALSNAGIAVSPVTKGVVLYRGGRLADARKELEAALAAGLPAAEVQEAMYYLAATRDDLGDEADAIALYDRTVALGPATAFAQRARYWAAHSMKAVGDIPSASARFTEAARLGGEFAGEAAFLAGYVHWPGAPARAAAAWIPFADDGRFQYWVGRSLTAAGDPAGADWFAKARASGGFWGAAASARLSGSPMPVPVYVPLGAVAPPDWAALEAWAGVETPIVFAGARLVTDLAFAGFRDEAAVLLESYVQSTDAAVLLGATRLAWEAGLRGTASRYAGRLARAAGGAPPAGLLRLQYPVDFPAELDAAAKLGAIDPLLLAALTRVESAWDPFAASSAAANGLTQVIPETGAALAAELGVEGFTTGDLRRAGLSLRFGAHYLSGQLKQFGALHLALAAYNAGPGRVPGWLAAAGAGAGPGEFVEAVAFEETRNYVVFVMEAYEVYLGLYRP